MTRTIRTVVLLCTATAALSAQQTTDSTRVRLNGFVDTYYAFDVTRPADGERRFTTQPVRHDEVNVNLAWIGVTVERERMRARLALQAGTSVQANYAGEPRNGATSGPELSQLLQEAVVGYRISDKLWLDGGVYSSYIGLEGWTSADNPTYTRSLVAEYTPYYLSGARLTWAATPRLTAQLHVMNGWQNISENNRSKAIGARLDYTVSPALTVSYANFIGNEAPTGSSGALRVFNQVMARGTASGWQWQGQVDLGQQSDSRWHGLVAIVRRPVTPRVAVVGRLERYSDPDQVIISTGRPVGFTGNGASAGVDVQLDAGLRWRSEVRGIRTADALYPEGPTARPVRTNGVLVTSLSVGF